MKIKYLTIIAAFYTLIYNNNLQACALKCSALQKVLKKVSEQSLRHIRRPQNKIPLDMIYDHAKKDLEGNFEKALNPRAYYFSLPANLVIHQLCLHEKNFTVGDHCSLCLVGCQLCFLTIISLPKSFATIDTTMPAIMQTPPVRCPKNAKTLNATAGTP